MDPSEPPTCQKLKNTLLMDAVTFVACQTTENSLQMGCISPHGADFPRFWPDFTTSHPPTCQPWTPMTPPWATLCLQCPAHLVKSPEYPLTGYCSFRWLLNPLELTQLDANLSHFREFRSCAHNN